MIVDAHLDLAYNAINNGRLLHQPLTDIRASEPRKLDDGIATVSIPEIRQGGIGLLFGTIFTMPANNAILSTAADLSYRTQAEAHRLGMGQLDYYHRLVDNDPTIRLVTDLSSLREVVASHADIRPLPAEAEERNGRLLGIVPLMEGADPIRQPEELELWIERGLRIVGPAWDDTSYASGAWRGSRHGFTKAGLHLLEVMADYNLILDLSHLSEKAALEALERYEGHLIASHSNCQALVNGERQLSNQQIQLIGERGGVIGVVLYNRFLKAGHRRGEPKQLVTLDHVVAHIDHICQLLGDADHVGIGSDLDGGIGYEDIPAEMNSIADLAQIGQKLRERGYPETAVTAVMGQNWINLLERTWAT